MQVGTLGKKAAQAHQVSGLAKRSEKRLLSPVAYLRVVSLRSQRPRCTGGRERGNHSPLESREPG